MRVSEEIEYSLQPYYRMFELITLGGNNYKIYVTASAKHQPYLHIIEIHFIATAYSYT